MNEPIGMIQISKKNRFVEGLEYMSDVGIYRHYIVQVYEMPYVIGMKQEKYRKCNRYRCVHET